MTTTATLVRRSVHRSAWRSSAGATVAALLAGMIALRVGANVLMAVDISLRGGALDVFRFAAVHGLFLVSLCAWTAGRRAAAIEAALSVPLFAAHEVFARRCRLRATAGRPAYLAPVAAALLMAGAAPIVVMATGAAPHGLVLAPVIVAGALLALLVAPTSRALRLGPERMETVEIIGLLLLLAANPDLAPGDTGVATILFSRGVPVDVPSLAGLMVGAALLPVPVMALHRAYELLSRIAVRRTPKRVLLVWYRRLCAAPWVVVFLCMTPVVVSGGLSGAARRWVAAVVGAGLVGWLVAVIATIDQALEFRWNRPVARRGSARPLVPLVLVHLALSAAVVLPAVIR